MTSRALHGGNRSASSLTRRGRSILGITGVLAIVMGSGQVLGQAGTGASVRSADGTAGKALFDAKCGMCHGTEGMGTALLSRTRPVALLEERGDLRAPYVVFVSRRGIGNMPALPRGELGDDELEQIAAYLANGAERAAR